MATNSWQEVPKHSFLQVQKQAPYYSDAFEFTTEQDLPIEGVYAGVFGQLPAWVIALLKLRNRLVKPFGFETSANYGMAPTDGVYKKGAAAGFLTLGYLSQTEVVGAASEAHMAFWVSVMQVAPKVYRLSTLVTMKSRQAKIYLRLIQPFHKLVITKSIAKAQQDGRL